MFPRGDDDHLCEEIFEALRCSFCVEILLVVALSYRGDYSEKSWSTKKIYLFFIIWVRQMQDCLGLTMTWYWLLSNVSTFLDPGFGMATKPCIDGVPMPTRGNPWGLRTLTMIKFYTGVTSLSLFLNQCLNLLMTDGVPMPTRGNPRGLRTLTFGSELTHPSVVFPRIMFPPAFGSGALLAVGG